jgi:hypothetical protein
MRPSRWLAKAIALGGLLEPQAFRGSASGARGTAL